MNIFKRKKSPKEVVFKFDEALGLYDISLPDGGGGTEESVPGAADLDKNMERMRLFLFGGEEKSGMKVEECHELSTELQASGIFHLMNSKLNQLPFETRKDWGAVFRAIVQNNYGDISDYLIKDENQGLLFSLLIGYSNPTIALHSGGMLRECLKYENIASIILYSNDFYSFFSEYLVNESFDVASDAFTTFRDLLTRHVGLVSTFLDPKGNHYVPFF
jgi:calcium binding protein 39